MPRNVIVAQSGGPSPVINSSLRGVVETCKQFPDTFGTVYAGWHGIEGVLKEELLNLSAQDDEEIALLRYTPAAGAIGTCRYKIKKNQQEDFQRVMEVLKAQVHAQRELVVESMLDYLQQDDLFTKAAIETSVDQMDENIEQLLQIGLPEETRSWLGMMGFRVIINLHGEVVDLDFPEADIDEE